MVRLVAMMVLRSRRMVGIELGRRMGRCRTCPEAATNAAAEPAPPAASSKKAPNPA